jgi:DEAD/DEAH box helicase domain-containing protein
VPTFDDGLLFAYSEVIPPRDAVFAKPQSSLHPLLSARLSELGISQLYRHQAHAVDAALTGQDLVVVTGTSSGKSLCYNLPAIHWSLSEPASRMLYLFPTKALSHDQLGKLAQLIPDHRARPATYDGDTPSPQRSAIRKTADMVLTNPDMLHVGILPGHELWTRFLKSLRLIVVDEMHVYRGVFGSHVGNILRRLLRLCEWHRNRPQIIACSATIGNPEELFTQLTGRTATLIDEDGSPRSTRTFVFVNPPEVDDLGNRKSTHVTSADALAELCVAGKKSLAFSRSRIASELVLRYTRSRLKRDGEVDPRKVESYRAGYTPQERRAIEQALFEGQLLGLSATNAMELGVDIGGLDAVVMNGYPGSIASFFQQAGRAGRGTHPGLVLMVAQNDPLDQYLIRNPDQLLRGTIERVACDPCNPQIQSQQLLCAAHERPLSPSELPAFGPDALDLCEELDRVGSLAFRSGNFYYPFHEGPASQVNIRSSSSESVALLLENETLGTMEFWRALQSAHAGAVYLHRGQPFLVKSLDLETKTAQLVSFDGDYYTVPIYQNILEPKTTLREQAMARHCVSLVGVRVTSMVIGYKQKSIDGETILAAIPLDLPPQAFETIAIRFDWSDRMSENEAQNERLAAAVHGTEHALSAVGPLFAGCDRSDLGSSWYAMFHDTGLPATFLYDSTPGGVGLCERLFDSLGPWCAASLQLLKGCSCDTGCPSCLYRSGCEINNEALDKRLAIQVLQGLLSA